MFNDFKNKIKAKTVDLSNIDSNFITVNSIMNQRLIGLLDYLKASIYFSHYNDKNSKKSNLEKFFKSKIFRTNPFSSPSFKNSLNSNLYKDKKENIPLNIIINIKNNKYTFQKNKYSTPYDLHSKKSNFLKSMVYFSKHIHSESKIENDLKQRYPKIESFPIDNNNKNLKIFFPMTPKIAKRKRLLISTDRFTSTYDDKNKNLCIKKNKEKIIRNEKEKTFLSFDNKKDLQKYRNHLNNNNHIFNNNINKANKKNNNKNKRMKIFKANCYYNNLRLKKLSQNLLKYTYLNEDN